MDITIAPIICPTTNKKTAKKGLSQAGVLDVGKHTIFLHKKLLVNVLKSRHVDDKILATVQANSVYLRLVLLIL